MLAAAYFRPPPPSPRLASRRPSPRQPIDIGHLVSPLARLVQLVPRYARQQSPLFLPKQFTGLPSRVHVLDFAVLGTTSQPRSGTFTLLLHAHR